MNGNEIRPENVAKAFGEVLRSYRKQRGLSQEKLAEMCDLDRTYISMLERAIHQPSLTAFLRLARALGMSATDMIESVQRNYPTE